MSDEFLLAEDQSVELVIQGKKFRIRPLSFEETRKVHELCCEMGLISAPFPVNEKTIKRLKFSILSALSTGIISLTGQVFAMQSLSKTENAIAA